MLSRHPGEAQEVAISNVDDLFERLGQRVDALEEFSSEEDFRDRFVVALRDPDFTLTLQAAVLAGARTPSHEKHDILAFIVAERLLHDADSLVAVASSMAVEAVARLAQNQLRLLGLAVLTYRLRPPEVELMKTQTPERAIHAYGQWLLQSLPAYLPLPNFQQIDGMHLESVGCARREPYLSELGRRFVPEWVSEHREVLWDELATAEAGRGMKHLWHAGLGAVTLTSVGELVGTYVHDRLTGARTPINWKQGSNTTA
jgi:hypothetical protein